MSSTVSTAGPVPALPAPSSAKDSLTDKEEWAALKAEVRAAGLKRAPSPTKSPTKRNAFAHSSRTPSSPPSVAPRTGAVSRPARTGETVHFTSVHGTPLQGVILTDGRVRPLQAPTPATPTTPSGRESDQPSGNHGGDGLAQRVAAARQAMSSSSSIQLPSSPAPRRPGRVAAAAAALDQRSGSSVRRVMPPSPMARHAMPPPPASSSSPHFGPRSPVRVPSSDKATIYLSNGSSLHPGLASPSSVETLRIPAAERVRVRNQIAQWHLEQSQRWTG